MLKGVSLWLLNGLVDSGNVNSYKACANALSILEHSYRPLPEQRVLDLPAMVLPLELVVCWSSITIDDAAWIAPLVRPYWFLQWRTLLNEGVVKTFILNFGRKKNNWRKK